MAIYEWPSRLQASLWYNISGHLTNNSEVSYIINSTNQNYNINLTVGYPVDLTKITDTTISIEKDTTFQIINPIEFGKNSRYAFNMEYDVFCKTDRDVEVLLYELSRHTREPAVYYKWDVVVTGGLVAGTTTELIWFERPVCRRLRFEKLETNRFLNHRGRMNVEVSVDANLFTL